MKHCPRCNQDKEPADFGKNRTRPDGLQVQCRACIKVIHRDWYERNRERHYANVQSRRKVLSTAFLRRLSAYLKSHPCVDCGAADPLVLVVEPASGRPQALLRGAEQGWETLLPALEQGVVRCANCARRRSAHRLGPEQALLRSLGIQDWDSEASSAP